MQTRDHRRGLLAFAALGYAYIGLIIVVLVALVVALWSYDLVGLIFLPAGTLFVVVFVLFIPIKPPEGHALTAAEAPQLFELIKDTGPVLQSPLPHSVLLTANVNAAVVDLPRLGLFGSRRWLLLGVPLLNILTVDEFRAILAHEFAHLSRRHGRIRLWPLRMQSVLSTLAISAHSERSWLSFLFVPFFRWYTPRLTRRVQRLSRTHEFESDALAASYAGAAHLGRALLRISLGQSYTQRVVLPALLRESLHQASPPTDSVARLTRGITGYRDDPNFEKSLDSILRESHSAEDSHPSISQRVACLGHAAEAANAEAAARFIATTEKRAALLMLLDQQTREVAETALGANWAREHAVFWSSLHLAARVAEQRAADAVADVHWARARWAAACLEPQAAVPMVRAALRADPESGQARALLGQLLVASFDHAEQREGAWLLAHAIDDDASYALEAIEALKRYYTKQGDTEQILSLEVRERQLTDATMEAFRERGTLAYADELRPYRLPQAELDHVRQVLQRHPEIQTAFLIQKRTRFLSDTPSYFLAITLKVSWYKPALEGLARRVSEAVASELPVSKGQLVVLALDSGSALHRRLRKMPGATIYSKNTLPDVQPAYEWSKPSFFQQLVSARLVTIYVVFLLVAIIGGLIIDIGNGDQTPEERIASARRAVAGSPANPEANEQLWWALFEGDSLDQAAEIAVDAIRLNPASANLHNSVGWVLMNREQFQEALPLLEKAIRLDPSHVHAYHNLGETLLRLGRVAEADSAMRRAVEISPKAADVRMTYATVLTSQIKYADAEHQVRIAVQLDSRNSYYRSVLASLLQQRGALDDAVMHLQVATGLQPDNWYLWSELGTVLHDLDRHPEAVAAFQRARALNPQALETPSLQKEMLDASLRGVRIAH